mmetsp:Transcript_54505/g.90383  ORF Transcript_54505/g.90383 Transcript_54505/m.90383 type:complete len:397 (+) Transcript_54505:28-1218(+)
MGMGEVLLLLSIFCASVHSLAGLRGPPQSLPTASCATVTRLDVSAPPRPKDVPVPALGVTPSGPSHIEMLWPKPSFEPHGPSEFELNQGRAIDTLRSDYPRIFTEKPDLSIFCADVALHDLTGKRLQGINQYAKMFDMLRFLRRTSMRDAEVTYHTFVHDKTIRMRWSANLLIRDPVFGIERIDIIDGVSVYELDSDGYIRTHKLENIVLRGHEQSQPISLAFAWPMPGLATPELAMPYFRSYSSAAADLVDVPVIGAATATISPLQPPAPRRSPVPQANAATPETPMQRAARERAEEAEKQRRLSELRGGLNKKPRGGLKALLGIEGPQTCESSYDCDAPLVCCDLLVASVCCSGGLMIPLAPEPALQPQAIPIPVDRGPQAPQGYPGYPSQSVY